MGGDRSGTAEEDAVQALRYPSPDETSMDTTPFYHTNRDDEQILKGTQPEEAATEQEGVANHHQLPDTTATTQTHPTDPELTVRPVEEGPHEQTDLPQNHDDSHTPAQSDRPSNLEELQLAAQLGHGLADSSIMTSPEASMQAEATALRTLMPHPDGEHAQHPSPYAATEHMGQHPLVVPIAPSLPPQYALNDGVPPRKRSKVSRACDECRRKKIKCDAQSDTGETACSNCTRSNSACLFSRVPQKRGPSKGYIKELADRIHSIEHKLEAEGGGSLIQDDLDKLLSRSSTLDDIGRKRPFSSISGDFAPSNLARQAPWGSLEARSAQSTVDDQQYTDTSLAPEPSEIPENEAVARPDGIDTAMAGTEEDLVDIDEEALHDYLANVQFMFPILPNSKARLQSLLSQCPGPIRTAFSTALLAVTRPAGGDVKLASSLLNALESLEADQPVATNIVHAQTLLLLILDADARTSPSLPYLLARAIALANSMKLWKLTDVDSISELDSDKQLCSRIWWSLVLMDRWHAAGTGKPSQIPDSSVVVPAGIETVVGAVCFHLIRLSKLLNRLSFVISTLEPGHFTADPPMASILADYIEDYREDLPSHVDPTSCPVVHLAYWHCRLLVSLLTPGATPAETFWPTRELASLLSANAESRFPLTNHFASLVTLSLSRLARIDSRREEVVQVVKEVLEGDGPVWDPVRERLAAHLRSHATGVEAAANQGLQHLADMATSNNDSSSSGHGQVNGVDDLMTLAGGYLDVVIPGSVAKMDGMA